ncbi:bifunctional phosphoribosylaminoimidazolecarboxamide formyltransferase/IMP cyclohydrolase [Clostridium hydrogeniformans]|uniref:bifunctional phosphoribosylaminoimidazolecarboxamide formyltransferase/IMP cyclohydrolase n=1 Tax=Clostridium hydrogeniformans TaxID=349933 RepID=UPI000488D14D|nr:bifunctional phosphoribosylaminoimidazolecarboxamide formyltransferase/IMP cyclohydrolase [Clostridium hydrogeniformans]
MKKRALISLYDKEGIVEFAKFLEGKGVEIISTGGTYRYLRDNGIKVIEISEVTNFKEMLDGRVKTLNPIIHGGILAIRDNKNHMETLKENSIETIDYVVVNLYPFFEKVKEDISFEEKIEFIDIGGPSMLRSAAKNFKDVVVLSDKKDYGKVMEEIEENNQVAYSTKRYLASKVFNLVSSYDAAISNFLKEGEEYDEYLTLTYRKHGDLRYGENPHQKAAYYVNSIEEGALNNFEILNGKELSYNNIKDIDIAWRVVNEFDEIACCALKHNSPCGVALGENVLDAYEKAYKCDPISIFGGIVSFNNIVDKKTAERLTEIFLEVIIADDFTEEALEILKLKKNLRVIKCKNKPRAKNYMVSVDGGILLQEEDKDLIKNIEVATEKEPTKEELDDLIFAMKVVKYVKSNAIVVAKDRMTLGIGGGQVNRIWAAKEALDRGNGALVMASDAFFPFDDVVIEASKYGIKSIIQPGGSINDKKSIDRCNELNISMVFTSMRHFRH